MTCTWKNVLQKNKPTCNIVNKSSGKDLVLFLLNQAYLLNFQFHQITQWDTVKVRAYSKGFTHGISSSPTLFSTKTVEVFKICLKWSTVKNGKKCKWDAFYGFLWMYINTYLVQSVSDDFNVHLIKILFRYTVKEIWSWKIKIFSS